MNIDPYIAEFIGTLILLLLGEGVVANVNLKKTIAEGQTPWVLITSAWGFSVFVAVFITSQFSGAHLNPAV
ncbi:MAG: aquaporin, partial [Flavobacteriales bacterium]|nr:aquaporin [Flavobacteriales bacterium]